MIKYTMSSFVSPKLYVFKNFAAIALTLLVGGCATFNPTTWIRVSVDMEKPFLFAKSVGDEGWGFVSHPRVTACPDGILVSYNLAGDVANESDLIFKEELLTVGPAFSSDLGKSWVFGVEAAEQNKLRHCDNIYKADTTLVRMPWKFMDYSYSSPSQHAVLPDGKVLVPAMRFNEGSTKFETILMATTNNGLDYFFHSMVATIEDAPWGNEGPNEAGLVGLDNGELLCVMRTEGGMGSGLADSADMLLARSFDEGVTWSMRRMLLPGVRPKLLKMSNGILVLAFGRPGNNLIFSLDNGNTWGNEVAVTRPDVKTSGYIDLVEVEPGRLLVVYDAFGRPAERFWLFKPNNINAVWGRFINIGKRF